MSAAPAPTPTTSPVGTISLAIDDTIIALTPSEHTNAQDLWWHILETTYGVTRPPSAGVGVVDMAAFIRDAVPLPQGPPHAGAAKEYPTTE